MLRRRVSVLTGALLLAAPRIAQACAVCVDPNDKNRVAFLATTAFMSAVPLGLAGGLIAWLRKKARGRDE